MTATHPPALGRQRQAPRPCSHRTALILASCITLQKCFTLDRGRVYAVHHCWMQEGDRPLLESLLTSPEPCASVSLTVSSEYCFSKSVSAHVL